jgi:hypothetical protein
MESDRKVDLEAGPLLQPTLIVPQQTYVVQVLTRALTSSPM